MTDGLDAWFSFSPSGWLLLVVARSLASHLLLEVSCGVSTSRCCPTLSLLHVSGPGLECVWMQPGTWGGSASVLALPTSGLRDLMFLIPLPSGLSFWFQPLVSAAGLSWSQCGLSEPLISVSLWPQ
uniref:Secreted protein n=1 Tax=Knipowitschia caucasica TaxID=637954 RepID=A0AAV2K1J5_KNICA